MKTIEWKENKIRIIDQTKLPARLVYLDIDDIQRLWRAIKKLKVRGAPAIGIAAALGALLTAHKSKAKTYRCFKKEIERAVRYLKKSRPTAVNLFWALERMQEVVKSNAGKDIASLKKTLLREAQKIISEDRDACRRMGRFGAGLVKNKDNLLTHCNAGALATADYGTALGVFYTAKNEGKKIKVYADETRPLLQGARLTAWELMQHKIDVTLICDNMAAHLMREGKIDKIFLGADRIAANGDAANKIGTYGLAVLAKEHKIPFYVVAPTSTFDLSLKSGKQIPIEQRDPQEVREIYGKQVVPKNVKVYNPAFDVTPNGLISAIITERGIFRKPYRFSLKFKSLKV